MSPSPPLSEEVVASPVRTQLNAPCRSGCRADGPLHDDDLAWGDALEHGHDAAAAQTQHLFRQDCRRSMQDDLVSRRGLPSHAPARRLLPIRNGHFQEAGPRRAIQLAFVSDSEWSLSAIRVIHRFVGSSPFSIFGVFVSRLVSRFSFPRSVPFYRSLVASHRRRAAKADVFEAFLLGTALAIRGARGPGIGIEPVTAPDDACRPAFVQRVDRT